MNQNSKIYVTGHTGMVGSALIRALHRSGFGTILTRTHKELDLTNQQAVRQFFEINQPEYVFLTAAKVGGIQANRTHMADFLIENLQIQNHVLQAAQICGVKKLLFTASSCIYPLHASQPIKEESLLTSRLEPTNEGYAVAKIAGLKACQYYHAQYGCNFITAMPANAYGIKDCFDPQNSHVIPALIRRFHEAKLNGTKEVILWGSGNAMREFLYVDDLAEACLFLMEHYEAGQFPSPLEDIVNIGTGEEASIRQLAGRIANATGYEGRIVYDDSKPDGMLRRVIDSGRIQAMGWQSRTSLQDGIQKTYEWYLRQEGGQENV